MATVKAEVKSEARVEDQVVAFGAEKPADNAITTKNGRHLRAVRTIKQTWLDEYLNLKLEKDALEAKLKQVVGQIEDKSDVLCAYFKVGIRPEKGPLTGEVKVRGGRRSVTKEQLIDVYGKAAYADLLNNAKKSDDKEYFEVLKRIV